MRALSVCSTGRQGNVRHDVCTSTICCRLTSAFSACMFWLEHRTEVCSSKVIIIFIMIRSLRMAMMLTICCANVAHNPNLQAVPFISLFQSDANFSAMQFQAMLRIFDGNFTRACVKRESKTEAVWKNESKVRMAFTMPIHYDLPFKYWVRTIKLHPACITLCFNDSTTSDHTIDTWTWTFGSI